MVPIINGWIIFFCEDTDFLFQGFLPSLARALRISGWKIIIIASEKYRVSFERSQFNTVKLITLVSAYNDIKKTINPDKIDDPRVPLKKRKIEYIRIAKIIISNQLKTLGTTQALGLIFIKKRM